MTLTDKLKILGDEIKANQLSMIYTEKQLKSSKEMCKYEYLTGEDL